MQRSREDWEKIFKLMGRMGGIISADLRAELPDAGRPVVDQPRRRGASAGERVRAPAVPGRDGHRGRSQ